MRGLEALIHLVGPVDAVVHARQPDAGRPARHKDGREQCEARARAAGERAPSPCDILLHRFQGVLAMRHILTLTCALLTAALVSNAAAEPVKFVRYPHASNGKLVFSYH